MYIMRFIRHCSLETMCLNVVISNIDVFLSDSEIPERHVQFLHRAYSDKLYQLMKKNSLIEEKYIQWLLTPHWNHVTLDTQDSYSDGILQKLKVMGSAITSLNLTNSLASESILTAIICCVPNVTHLDLSGTVCSDMALMCIRRMCPSVSYLGLADCTNVSDQGMKHLYTFNEIITGNNAIKNLDITQTRVTKKGVATILKLMPLLQILKYENLSIILYQLHKSDIHKDCCETIHYNLTEFIHFHSEINLMHVLEVWTVFCPKVTSVFIIDVTSESHLQLCSRFTHLKELRLLPPHEYEELNAKNISPFLKIRGEMLTTLCMLHMTVSVDVLVQTCKNIRNIFFHNMTYEDFTEHNYNEELNKLNHLETLVLKHADFSVCSTFKSLRLLLTLGKHLKKLCIKNATKFTEDVTDIILNSSDKLLVVDFSFTDIKLPSLLRFFSSPAIQKIYVDSCINISTEGNSPLSKFVNIEYENTCSWQLEFDNDIDDDKFIPYEFWWRLL